MNKWGKEKSTKLKFIIHRRKGRMDLMISVNIEHYIIGINENASSSFAIHHHSSTCQFRRFYFPRRKLCYPFSHWHWLLSNFNFFFSFFVFAPCHFFLFEFRELDFDVHFQGKIKRILNFWWNELDLKLELNIRLDCIGLTEYEKFESGFYFFCWTDWFDVGSGRLHSDAMWAKIQFSLVGWSKVSSEEDVGGGGRW